MLFLFARCTLLIAALGSMLLPFSTSFAQAPPQKPSKPSWVDRFFGLKHDTTGGWLFAGFKNDSRDGVYFAISKDGYHWTEVNDGRPMIKPAKRDELMRDPFIQRVPSGGFRMVWTWAWGKPTVIGYSTSDNLLFWSEHRQLPVTAAIPTAVNAWAPALYYDAAKKDWLIFWSSTVPPEGKTGSPLDHRIYSTTTRDFKQFTPAKLYFDPGYNVIDATLLIVPDNAAPDKPAQYYLVFKDERTEPLEKHILTASGPSMEGPWQYISLPITEPWSEGPAAITVSGGYLVYYDHYRDPQHYGAIFFS
jgi:hypothetical protein